MTNMYLFVYSGGGRGFSRSIWTVKESGGGGGDSLHHLVLPRAASTENKVLPPY